MAEGPDTHDVPEAPGSTPPVFLVDDLPAADSAVLDGDEARHAVTVRRTRAGGRLILAGGGGGLAACVVDAVERDRPPTLDVPVLTRRQGPEPALRVTVVPALAERDRGVRAIDLGSEAGAAA